MTRKPFRVLFAAAESFPLVKVGGLADAAHALSKALTGRGHDVTVVLPHYDSLPPGEKVDEITVGLPEGRMVFQVRDQGAFDGVHYITLDNGEQLGPPAGYVEKDLISFVFFSKAVAELAQNRDRSWDIVHCHDWHLGHCPAQLRATPSGDLRCRSVLTIHNLAYQGRYSPEQLGNDSDPLLSSTAHRGNLLAQGITAADVVTTVSERYRVETLATKHGMGLHDVLRARERDYHGILNGVDYDEFDPRRDPRLVANYDVDHLDGKAVNKKELQRRHHLAEDPNLPVITFVARLVRQKGIELVLEVLDRLAALDAQIVIVGTGADYERLLTRAARHFPNVVYIPSSDEKTARMAYAAGDIFLAPSEYEPCGLAPLIALRYGAVPVVHRVGGMAETIGHTDNAEPELGFGFDDGSPSGFVDAVTTAACWYREPEKWSALRRRAMRADFSWHDAGARYEQLYAGAMGV